MRYRLKIIFMMIFIAGAAFILNGCISEPFSFDLTFAGVYMNDKIADILIPVDETDRGYTNYNQSLYRIESGRKMPDISSGSQIALYDEEGSRSMLLHLDGTSVNFKETEDGLVQSITLPERYGGRSGFNRFCDEFKVMRLAVFDENGDILSISEEIPLVRHSDYYIDRNSLNFDPLKNTISPEYDITATDVFVIMAANFFLIIDLVYVLVLVLVTVFTRHSDSEDNKVHIILASVLNIPSILTLFILLRKEFITHLSADEAMMSFVRNNGIIKIIGLFVPTAILIYFCMKSYIKKRYGDLPPDGSNNVE